MFDKSVIISRLRRCCRSRLVKFRWGGKRLMAQNSALCLLPSRCSGCSTWHHISPIDDIFFFQGYLLTVAEICYWRLENSREESLIVAAFETPMRKALGSTIFSVWQKTALGPYIALGNLHTFSEPFHCWSSYHHRGCINCDTNIYWYWYVSLYHFTKYLPCAFCKFLKYFHVCLFRDC